MATAAGRTVEETIKHWRALCDGNRIRVDIDHDRWSTEFSGPSGARLREGTYENAAESPLRAAVLA